jgi:ABC-type transport system involved in cytochrome bd biosynthesis fused ATPase/permease subunit
MNILLLVLLFLTVVTVGYSDHFNEGASLRTGKLPRMTSNHPEKIREISVSNVHQHFNVNSAAASQDSRQQSKMLTGTAIAGVVVGVVLALLIIFVVVWFFNSIKENSQNNTNSERNFSRPL